MEIEEDFFRKRRGENFLLPIFSIEYDHHASFTEKIEMIPKTP